MAIQRPKGTQDLLPGEIEKWHYLENVIRQVCRDYGYEEIRTPIFEATELFERGVGETTDIVNKEMYTFIDKGNRSLTLRPEGTASVCRAFVENKLHAGTLPVKLYYIGPMFRYENTQKGRYRQFHQFGVEVLGADQPIVDAEVIQMVWELYRRLGLKDIEVLLNSVGCPECRSRYRNRLQEFLKDKQDKLCGDCRSRLERNPLRILDCKNRGCQELTADAPTINTVLCDDCADHFAKVKSFLDVAGVKYRVNPRLVRGLDYYCKTAFEVLVDDIGAQNAICGGGRYDGLIESIGGPPTPGIGFAMGMERVLAAMERQQCMPDFDTNQFVMIVALGDQAQHKGFELLGKFREMSVPASIDLLGRKLKSQLKAADKQGVKYVLILGDEELEQQKIILRDLSMGEQEEIPLNNAIEAIKEKYYEVKGK